MEASATTQISRLQKMGLKELRAEYEKVFEKPTKSRNRKQLFSQIAKKIQADRGGHQTGDAPTKPTLTVKFERKKKATAGAKKKTAAAKKAAKPRPIGQRDPRLPKVGTTITKTYKGKTLNVRVLEKGFEYDGQVFRSLSGLAKHVTGAIWNGFGFFGLLQKEGKKS
ncbi:DUF2924 domain-containing protein [Candidatus Zixiibacteriota bacterium]